MNTYTSQSRTNIISDTYLIQQFVRDAQPGEYYKALLEEVDWQTMSLKGGLVPRKIAIQGEVTEQALPLYRHPNDGEPPMSSWTPVVRLLRNLLNDQFGIDFNHVLVQWYRNGKDWIGRHADKTLDITHHTPILNLSFGATRTMLIRAKISGENGQHESTRVNLLDNSLLVFGPETNRHYHHQINQDKRAEHDKQDDERLMSGGRISLTFRSIATFVTPDGDVFGQGGRFPDLESVRHCRQDNPAPDPASLLQQTKDLANSFRAENTQSDFDWQHHYGNGFDVLDLRLLNSTPGSTEY